MELNIFHITLQQILHLFYCFSAKCNISLQYCVCSFCACRKLGHLDMTYPVLKYLNTKQGDDSFLRPHLNSVYLNGYKILQPTAQYGLLCFGECVISLKNILEFFSDNYNILAHVSIRKSEYKNTLYKAIILSQTWQVLIIFASSL